MNPGFSGLEFDYTGRRCCTDPVQIPDHYSLKCVKCGWEVQEDTHQVTCPTCGVAALLRCVYADTWKDILKSPGNSLGDYSGWLPVRDAPGHWADVRVGCFRGEELGRKLGLENLWVIFSGYWPRRDAGIPLPQQMTRISSLPSSSVPG